MPKLRPQVRRNTHLEYPLPRIPLVIIIPILIVTLVGSAIGQKYPQSKNQKRVSVAVGGLMATTAAAQATPTPPALIKEYIYSNGQLVATAEPIIFNDVTPANPFYNDILRIAQAEVTLGNGSGGYVPADPVSRAQMAAFITRALGYYSPPLPAFQRFNDVPPSDPFYSVIELMAVFNITLGCGDNNYCPSSSVTHEQMATFLVRACGVANPPVNPPLATFNDVVWNNPDPALNNPFRGFIGVAGAKGIWGGCGGGNYCPSSNVTREQMARMLVNNFDLETPMDHSKLTDSDSPTITHPRACKWSLP